MMTFSIQSIGIIILSVLFASLVCASDVRNKVKYSSRTSYNDIQIARQEEWSCDLEENFCENGGTCVEQGNFSTCSCLEGTTGQYCEIVENCSSICGTYPVVCYFNTKTRKSSCGCDHVGTVYDSDRRVCQKPCQVNSDCYNGGKCTKSGGNKFCFCLEGTGGDKCEIVHDCEDGTFCGWAGYCYFDVDRVNASCHCIDEEEVFDPVKKVCRKKCDPSNGDCKNSGICITSGDYAFCSCRDRTAGDFCEYVVDCLKTSVCGTQATCFLNNNDEVSCKCYDEDQIFDPEEKVCKDVRSSLTTFGIVVLVVGICFLLAMLIWFIIIKLRK